MLLWVALRAVRAFGVRARRGGVLWAGAEECGSDGAGAGIDCLLPAACCLLPADDL